MKTRLENLFLKRVKELSDTANKISNEEGYWPFSYSHEAKEKDCFKRPDGLWQLNHKINCHMKDGGSTVIFIWRIAPNYCTAGQPCYSAEQRFNFLQQSETEKVLVKHEGYEFVWMWDELTGPTKNIWGLSMGETYYVLRKDNEILVKTNVKKYFREEVKRCLNILHAV
jgi:hypothetical protein